MIIITGTSRNTSNNMSIEIGIFHAGLLAENSIYESADSDEY